ncbi:hypothetical protein N7489_001192 [Penicillium chrysogenum]|uniref:Aflatrem synthesis protein A n=1 Tax=Penicillium chrysogenum TaxID=5076 RepID=A0ABQ8WIE8_PENCH|nr:uncharacterized protein N7489_001192 [Penicillium chrysogenum]KAJ5250782.1 hypothetical protein N7489_001192 [Penicillium chrysogenum]KAJ5266392.1 hypothetical protein N7524_007410 [Penicillium chrysogenum]KAJ5269680.1 hypothetical protein N7505_005438 [Penicillium chrysogenum]KAJ6147590.1 hypothetical protein N7497_009572 [Penicillium chrysogenum]
MRYILFSLSALVFYAIFYFSYINGLDALARRSIESGKLPSFDAPLRTVYTGIKEVDHVLTLLTTFFYPALDGNNPGLLLHGVGFSGTFGATWTLIVLESWRKGNAGTIAAYPTIFGLAAQVLTFAFGIPLTCALQLGCSITARRPHADNIRIPRAVLAVLPLVFVVGYMVPTVAMALPAPSVIPVDLKQIAIAIWHPWPAYVSILTTVAYFTLSPFFSNNHRASMSSLRWVYAFAFANASLSHMVTLVVSLATVVVPVLFEDRFLDSLHPANVFSIPLPWSGLTVDNVGDGVHVFLRWDYMIGSAGVLIWAISLYTVAHKQLLNNVSWLSLLVKTALLTVLVGPAGTAVELIWERDELVFTETGGNKQEVSKAKKST